MTACYRTAVLLVLASSLLRAQLAIENPKHLDVSEAQAQALFLTTIRVMEKEFNVPTKAFEQFKERLKSRFEQIDIWMTTHLIEVV